MHEMHDILIEIHELLSENDTRFGIICLKVAYKLMKQRARLSGPRREKICLLQPAQLFRLHVPRKLKIPSVIISISE